MITHAEAVNVARVYGRAVGLCFCGGIWYNSRQSKPVKKHLFCPIAPGMRSDAIGFDSIGKKDVTGRYGYMESKS